MLGGRLHELRCELEGPYSGGFQAHIHGQWWAAVLHDGHRLNIGCCNFREFEHRHCLATTDVDYACQTLRNDLFYSSGSIICE